MSDHRLRLAYAALVEAVRVSLDRDGHGVTVRPGSGRRLAAALDLVDIHQRRASRPGGAACGCQGPIERVIRGGGACPTTPTTTS